MKREGEMNQMDTSDTPKKTKLSNDGTLPIPMSRVEAMEWLSKQKESIRPWSTFFAPSNFKGPNSAQKLSRNVVGNVQHFQSNYFFVFIGLFIYCLVTSPLLLLAFTFIVGLCYGIVMNSRRTEPLTLFGKELTLAQQYSIVGLCSMPLFYIVGAGAVLFWVLGASCFLIMAHATFYDIDCLFQPTEEAMELTVEDITETNQVYPN